LGRRNETAAPIKEPLSAVVNKETVTDDKQDKITGLKRRIARGEAMLRSLTQNPTTYSNAVMESVISEIEHQKLQLEMLEQKATRLGNISLEL
jgi:hypothetical protein